MTSRGCVAALLCAVCCVVGCVPEHTYEIKGRVVGFGDDSRTVIIEHEDVPGLMPAMTMSFKAADSSIISGFTQGDAVAFTLVISPDSSWIRQAEVLPDSAVAEHPAGEEKLPPPISGTETVLLNEGDVVPPVTLIDQKGNALRLDAYEGQVLLLTFIYTRCPLPDYCPLMSSNFQHLQDVLQPRYGEQVQLLSISFDTVYDTPEVLRDYARRYTDDLSNWTFATGTEPQIARVTSLFGVLYEPSPGTIDHNLVTVLIGPDGRLREAWRGNDWRVDEVEQAVEAVLESPTS